MNNLSIRRNTIKVGPYNTNCIYPTNPWTLAAWTFYFPGFGQILLGNHLQGWILISWEVFINLKANFNTAIFYTMLGRFQEANACLHGEWLILYGPVFCYALCSSYEFANVNNMHYQLAMRESGIRGTLQLSSIELNFLDRRKPWVAGAWSLVMPGLGQFYTNRLLGGIYAMAWWVVILHFAHMEQAIRYAAVGHFEMSKSVLDPEWLLFLPSIYAYACYNACVTADTLNRYFRAEQAQYLRANYQRNHGLSLPVHRGV